MPTWEGRKPAAPRASVASWPQYSWKTPDPPGCAAPFEYLEGPAHAACKKPGTPRVERPAYCGGGEQATSRRSAQGQGNRRACVVCRARRSEARLRMIGIRERIIGIRERIIGIRERIIGKRERIIGIRERMIGIRERIIGIRVRMIGIRVRIIGTAAR